MDESPKQLLDHVREPLPARPGSIAKVDDEYVRLGTAELFLAIEPLTGKLKVDVEEHRSKKDWAEFIRNLVDEDYAAAEKVVIVMDNLNTHKVSALYEKYSPEEALRIASKLEIHYTPKHGSWLNVAEIGFSLLKRMCIPERVNSLAKLRSCVNAYVKERNEGVHKVNWQFTAKDARIKLRHLYPEL